MSERIRKVSNFGPDAAISSTGTFRALFEHLPNLPINTLLDGDVVALEETGRTSFNMIQHHRSQASAILFYAFDVVVYRGHSTIGIDLLERRKFLTRAIEGLGDDILNYWTLTGRILTLRVCRRAIHLLEP